MAPHFKMFAGALLCAVTMLSDSEAGAQSPVSGANPTKAGVPPQLPPVPPVPPSPIDYFRKLLEASPAEREKMLEAKSAESRRVLTNGLRSYLTLAPDQRELRLRTMELRHYLAPLLHVAPSNRPPHLALIPESYRALVEQRLVEHWDRLTPELRQEALDNGSALTLTGLLTPLPPMPPVPTPVLHQFASNQLSAIARWTNYTETKRQKIAEDFTRVVSQPPSQKQKELAPLPLTPAERAQMEQTLDAFAKMTPMQRTTCVRAFTKLAEMSPVERQQFLRNAESWQSIKPEDRQRWRTIVDRLPPMPPLPAGFGTPPLPPIPPVTRLPPVGLLVTNGQ